MYPLSLIHISLLEHNDEDGGKETMDKVEYWDIYDKNKQRTGRQMKRNDSVSYTHLDVYKRQGYDFSYHRLQKAVICEKQ